MRTELPAKKDSTVYDMIQALQLSEHDRTRSLDALRDGDLFADGLVWTIHKIEALTGHLFGKPALKH